MIKYKYTEVQEKRSCKMNKMKIKEFLGRLVLRMKAILPVGKAALLICIPLSLSAFAIGILTLDAERGSESLGAQTDEGQPPDSLAAEIFNAELPPNCLEYQSLGNGECMVMGLGSFEGSELYIPETSPFGDTVIGIGNEAFEGCTGLVSVSIPKTVSSVGSGVFRGCSSLVHISVDSSNESYCAAGGILYSKDKSVLLCCPAARIGNNFLLDTSVRVISDHAFYGNLNISKILYKNSPTDFESISVGEGNEKFLSLPITCNYVPSK